MKRGKKLMLSCLAAVVIALIGFVLKTHDSQTYRNDYLLLQNIEALSQDEDNSSIQKYSIVNETFVPSGKIVAIGENSDTLAITYLYLLHEMNCYYPDKNATRKCLSSGFSSHAEKGSEGVFTCPYSWLLN